MKQNIWRHAHIFEAILLRSVLKKLNMIDNKSAIASAENTMIHECGKHINSKYYNIRECTGRNEVKMELFYMKLQDLISCISKAYLG